MSCRISQDSSETNLWRGRAGEIKIAADLYPMRFIAIRARPKKEGGGWAVEEI
jgi:hypothetical protein